MPSDADRRWVDEMPAIYDRLLADAVFRPFAVDLAARVAASPVHRVLELAAGTGVLTRELSSAVATAHVVATDLNPAMVDYGRHRVPVATWEQADATDLHYDDASFDLVTCQFGIMFVPDRPAAFVEARRVLAPGGRLLFNTWAPVETHDFALALVRVVSAMFPDDPPKFVAAVPHGYHDVDVISADVSAGGFRDVAIDTITLEGTATSASDIAVGFCTGTPLRAELERRGDLDSAVARVDRELQAMLGAGPVTARMTAHVVEATAPQSP